MTVPQAHRVFLERTGYTPRFAGDLSASEAKLLDRYGHWLEALATGAIEPVTPEQAHFVHVAQGAAAPETDFERVWAKVAPTAPAEVLLGVPARPRVTPRETATPAAQDRLAELAAAKGRAEVIRRRREAEREAILDAVRARLEEVDAKYDAELRRADAQVSELEAAVKSTS